MFHGKIAFLIGKTFFAKGVVGAYTVGEIAFIIGSSYFLNQGSCSNKRFCHAKASILFV